MNRDQKAAVVEELTEQIRGAEAIFAVDYRGISVAEAAELRAKLRDAGTRFRVVKNSLTERATDQAGADVLRPLLEGPTALAFVAGDAALAAKALNDAARNLGTLEFKGGVMNGSALTADDVRSIARLPAREVLHGQLVGTIASPLSGLVRTLNALISGLAVQLGQIADQGLVSGEAPAAPAEAAEELAAGDAAPASEATEEPAAGDAAPASEATEEPVSGDEGAEQSARAASESDAAPPETADEATPEPEASADAQDEPASETDAPAETSETESDASAAEPQAEEPKEE